MSVGKKRAENVVLSSGKASTWSHDTVPCSAYHSPYCCDQRTFKSKPREDRSMSAHSLWVQSVQMCWQGEEEAADGLHHLCSQEAEGNAPRGLLSSLVSFCLVLDQLDSSCPPRAFGWRAHTKMTTKPGAVFTFWALRPACVSFCVGVIVVGIVVGAWLMLPVDRVIIELREREQHSKGLPQKLGGNYTAPSSKQNDHPCLAPKGPGR